MGGVTGRNAVLVSVFVNLTQTGAISEKGASTEKMHPSDQTTDKHMDIFYSFTKVIFHAFVYTTQIFNVFSTGLCGKTLLIIIFQSLIND